MKPSIRRLKRIRKLNRKLTQMHNGNFPEFTFAEFSILRRYLKSYRIRKNLSQTPEVSK